MTDVSLVGCRDDEEMRSEAVQSEAQSAADADADETTEEAELSQDESSMV